MVARDCLLAENNQSGHLFDQISIFADHMKETRGAFAATRVE